MKKFPKMKIVCIGLSDIPESLFCSDDNFDLIWKSPKNSNSVKFKASNDVFGIAKRLQSSIIKMGVKIYKGDIIIVYF